jgi:long-chain acyl-CoA synthetase
MIAESQRRRLELTAPFANFKSTVEMFRSRLEEDAARPAATRKLEGRWVNSTWGELAIVGEELAFGLIALGIKPREMVALIGATRLEWTFCDLGVMHAGAVSVPIYHTNTPEETRFILDDAGAVLACVENTAQLAKLQQIKDRLPRLHHVVLMEGEGRPGDGWVLSLQQLRKLGVEQKAKSPAALAERLAGQEREDLHTVLYTSGTTGQPKGVMITNDNMLFAAEAVVGTGLLNREMRHLMFLPFAHSFAQIIKCGWLGSGNTQIFAESVEKLIENASQTAPTALSAVPRVYEKLFNAVVAGGMAQSGLSGALFRMAMQEFELFAKAQKQGKQYSSFRWALARKVVLPKVRQKMLGLFGGQMKQLVSGGAPLARKIGIFLDLLGFDILEGYGLTETIALISVNLPGQNRLGTVVRPYPGVEVKLSADGELLQRGRHIMRGYYNKPAATAEVIDKDGWFATGDVAEIDKDGYIRITDRKKDLIKTSGGKYIAPQAIEGALKTISPLISQVVVIGDEQKYVAVLLTVVEAEAKKLAAAASEPAGTHAEAARSRAVQSQVRDAIERLNAGLASYETVKRFVVLDHDFSQDAGQLTPTLKVKRKFCTAKYKAEIDEMYRDE